MSDKITIERIWKRCSESLYLELIAGSDGLDKTISTSELNRPGLALAGYFGIFSNDRIQILGQTELAYLRTVTPEERQAKLTKMFEYDMPALIVTSNQEVPQEIIGLAQRTKTPLFRTTLLTSQFSSKLSFFLEKEFAPSISIHGTMVDVFGIGALLLGAPGSGKSEVALELVERNHRLIADDVVILRKMGKNRIVAFSNERLGHHLEVRGLGIIDVEKLYGIGAVLEEKVLSLVIKLEKWENVPDIDRVGLVSHKYDVAGVPIPEYTIPVEAGRNIAILVEVACLQERLREVGHNPARELNQRLIESMTRRK
ncbi:MAG: HPr(Ser) kinase/phosphatase [Candidatus Sumerlaeia bacterium]